MFEMERLNHSRTEVYEDLCVLFPVDTSKSVDKLEKIENSFKFERFDVFPDFKGMPSDESVRNEEQLRSLVGFARPCHVGIWPSHSQMESPAEPYLLARPNEFDRLVVPSQASPQILPDVCAATSLVGLSRSKDTMGMPAPRFIRERVSIRVRKNSVRERDAAQALQSDSKTCRGVQDGSITGWEDASTSQKLAGRESHEEMAQ